MFTSAHMCIFALVLGCVCAHLLNSSSACPFYICCQTKYTHSPPFCQWFCAAHHLCAASPVALNICGRFIIWWSEPCSLAGCLVGCQLVCLRKQHVYATHSANVYARFHIFLFFVFFLWLKYIRQSVTLCVYLLAAFRWSRIRMLWMSFFVAAVLDVDEDTSVDNATRLAWLPLHLNCAAYLRDFW